eukprot:s1673_g10.t1
MLFLALKPDGLVPWVCNAGDVVSVADIETAKPRSPDIAELTNHLTIPQGQQMLKRVGMKNTGSTTKDAKFSSYIRDWQRISDRAVELGEVRDRSQVGKKKLVGFSNTHGIHYCAITSGEVFTLNSLQDLRPNPCDREMAMTLTLTEMKDLLDERGWTGNTSFRSKSDAVGYVMDELNNQMTDPIVEASDDEQTSDEEDDDEEHDHYVEMIDEIVAMTSNGSADVKILTDASDFHEIVRYAQVQSNRFQSLFSVKYDGANTTVAKLKDIIVEKIVSIADTRQDAGYPHLKTDDFRLEFRCVTMNNEDLVETYAQGDEFINVQIHLRLRGGGKAVKKNDKMAVVRARCGAKVASRPVSNLIDDAEKTKYNTIYEMLMNNPASIQQLIEKMSAADATEVVKLIDEGKLKANTLHLVIGNIVSEISALKEKRDYFTHILDSISLAFNLAMTNYCFDDDKGKFQWEGLKDAVKTRKISEEQRLKHSQPATAKGSAPMQTG